MVSDTLKDIIDEFNKHGKMLLFDGVTDEQIASFEKDHGIVLPSKYKEWLKFSDGGDLFLPASAQFYGVARKPMIDEKNDARPSDQYTVIGALPAGDSILCEKESERITIYNPGKVEIDDDEIYDDFIAFLRDLTNVLGIGG